MLATLPDGGILWCNASFEELLGYTSYELVGKMSWADLTTDKDELEADLVAVQEVVSGSRKDYQLQKAYRKKSGIPCDVIIHVLRHPQELDREFHCFLVSCAPLDMGERHALEVINDTRTKLYELEHYLTSQSTFWRATLEWGKENPWKAGIVGSIFAGFLFGDRFLDVLQRVVQIFRGTSGQ